MIISYRMMYLSCLHLHFVKSYGSARVRHDGPEFKIFYDFHVFNPELVGMQDLALRVLPAVTWLAVYHWLHIEQGLCTAGEWCEALSSGIWS